MKRGIRVFAAITLSVLFALTGCFGRNEIPHSTHPGTTAAKTEPGETSALTEDYGSYRLTPESDETGSEGNDSFSGSSSERSEPEETESSTEKDTITNQPSTSATYETDGTTRSSETTVPPGPAPEPVFPPDLPGDDEYSQRTLLSFDGDVTGDRISFSPGRCRFELDGSGGVSGGALRLISEDNTAEVYISVEETDFSPYDGLLFYADVSGVVPSKNDATGVAVRLWSSKSQGGNDYIWTRNTAAPIVLGHEIKAYYYESGLWNLCDASIMNGERVQLPDGFAGWVYIPFSSYVTVRGPEGDPVSGIPDRSDINRLMLLTGPYSAAGSGGQNNYEIIFDEINLVRIVTPHDTGGGSTAFLGYDRLGVSGKATYSPTGIVSVIPSENGQGFDVQALNEGSATVTVNDPWGHTAEFRVEVSSGLMIESLNVTTKYSDKKSVNVRSFGAAGNGVTDDTPAIQAAINSLKGQGGTLYFPAGVYPVTRLILCGDLTIVLEGNVSDVSEGFTETLKNRIENGEFAVIRNSFASANFMLNHDPAGSGRAGVGNIKITGGVIDMNGSVPSGEQIVDIDKERPAAGGASNSCAFVFSNASGFTVDNVVFKDNFNGHAFQLTGCSDVIVRNCLFAGYTATKQNMTTRETIQIEYAHSGAIPPSSYDPGEYYFCRNIEITGCCFTNSDKAGYHMIPIGQHGMCKEPNCTGLKITNNVFVNPYINGVRLLSYADAEISGNRFVSALPGTGDTSGGTPGFINIPLKTSDVSYNGRTVPGEERKIIYSRAFEHLGTKNVSIKENTFEFCRDSVFRAISISAPRLYTEGLGFVSDEIRQVPGTLLGNTYSGFVRVSNTIRGIRIENNILKYSGSPVSRDCWAFSENAYDVYVGENAIEGFDGFVFSDLGINGLRIINCPSGERARILSVIFGDPGYTVTLCCTDGELVITGQAPVSLTLTWDEGVGRPEVKTNEDGSAEISISASVGKITAVSGVLPDDGKLSEDVTLHVSN
ncbi:MAG: right-handed parallel beta-helix repeat-containing protein [Clostridia bacterium]|nr:right-handed parallel beta-helix repeat-containing protein [Clostridia bacterium]